MERALVIVAGFGCRRSADAGSLRAALLAALGSGRPDLLAGPADRALVIAPLAAAIGVRLIALAPDAIAGVATPTRSSASLRSRGTGSVAEAAALVAAGPGGRILVTRVISSDRRATCAIAEGPPS